MCNNTFKSFDELLDINLSYENIHSHSFYSNIVTHDSIISRSDIALRAVELGHQTLSCLEHGYCGDVFGAYKIAEKHNLKLIFGTEFYYVKDRFEKDRTNSHVLVVAKTETGREAITELISEASTTGFYGRPRIDESLLFSLPKDDVIVTTACIASPVNLYDEEYARYFVQRGKEYFGKNFFLEVQPHTHEKQQAYHKKLIKLKDEFDIEMILGVDTHYIYEKDHKLRDIYLRSRNMFYPEEDGFIMDYPEVETIIERFKNQSVLSPNHVYEAFNSTLVARDFEGVKLNKDIKMPSLYKHLSHEEKVKKLKDIVNEAWKIDRRHIPKERWNEYIKAIQLEISIIEDTEMEDYFLLNERVIDRAVNEKGGVLTRTGRGCFEETALIQTKKGLKKISDVEIGDFVINRFGDLDKVINKFEYNIENEDMIKIEHLYQSGKNFPVFATLDHKILVRDGNTTIFKEAKNLTNSDYICMPKMKKNKKFVDSHIDLNNYNTFGYRYDDDYIYEEYNSSNSRYNKKVKRFIKNDKTLNTFIGLMYGDGNTTKENSLSLYLNTTNHKNTINRDVFMSVSKSLGLDVVEYVGKNKNLTTLTMKSKVFNSFMTTEFFKSSIDSEKTFNTNWYDQPIDNLKGIRDGLLLSDGSLSDNREAFDNSSISLVSAYKMLNDLIGLSPMGLSHRESGKDDRGYNRKESYKLRKPSENNSKKRTAHYLEDDNYYYLPITKLTTVNRDKVKVYDLQIKNDPSFVIYNMVVHNSAPSSYVNKLLGFTEVDRLEAPVTLFTTRFMSVKRILETKSLPDIDFNTADPKPFMEATKELLGEDNAYQMIAYGTMQEKDAFKSYCRGMNIPKEEYWDISEDLDVWRKTEKWGQIIKDSEVFIDVVTSMSPHPCAILLLSEPISKKVGIIRGKHDVMVALIDSGMSDEYKYLKNDYLVVTVWDIIAKVYEQIGMPIDDVRSLTDKVKNDEKVWKLYEDGIVSTLNQAGTDSGKPQVMQYKPQSVRELSMWVSAIRPAFASLKSTFLNRQPFTYDIKALDELLATSDNFILFQENIMAVLQYAGFEEDETYGLLKAISKKKKGIIEPIHERFIKGFMEQTGSEEDANAVWQVIEDAVGYGFNSSHAYSVALDSLYGAYLKANFPLEYFAIVLNIYKGNKEKQSELINELSYFDIRLEGLQFGKSLSDYSFDKETNTIYKGISTVAYLNDQVADNLYNLGNENDYKDNEWVKIVLDIVEGNLADNRQMNILIKLGYFRRFGEDSVLLELYNTVTGYQKKKPNPVILNGEKLNVKYSRTHTEKTKEKRMPDIYKYYELVLESKSLLPSTTLYKRLEHEIEYMGYATTVDLSAPENHFVVMGINTKYTPIYKLYNVFDGHEEVYKIDKQKAYYKTESNAVGNDLILKVGDVFELTETSSRPKMQLIEGKWHKNPDVMQNYIEGIKFIEKNVDN